jgi:hypothetical protein
MTIEPVELLSALPEPPAFVAVTVHLMTWPTSAETSVYVEDVAPPMAEPSRFH